MKRLLLGLLCAAFCCLNVSAAAAPEAAPRILVFTKTAGYRHASIADGVAALQAMARAQKWVIEHTEDASVFTPEKLAPFKAIVFLNTSGDILDEAQMASLRGYLASGKGFVGVHAATDTETKDPWYPEMIGARFASHPKIQPANLNVHKRVAHPAIAHLGDRWHRTDEWYDFREPLAAKSTVLLDIDESSYEGGRMGAVHPMSWFHVFEGGRVFYTALGHTPESYREAEFLKHLQEGIRWAGGL